VRPGERDLRLMSRSQPTHFWVTLDCQEVDLAVRVPRSERMDERFLCRRQQIPRASLRKADDVIGVLE